MENRQEPVNQFTVHIADGQLAFVRADAHLIRDGQRRSHDIDCFTLIRDDEGNWKFVNGSYTTKPVQPQWASGHCVRGSRSNRYCEEQ